MVGIVSAIPPLCALAAAYLMPCLASHTGHRRLVGGLSLTAAGGAIAVLAFGHPAVGVLALCVAWAGFIGVQPVFWTFPTEELRGTAAAGGLALINSCGAVGGFFAPNVKTWAERAFASAAAGYAVLAFATIVGALLLFRLPSSSRRVT
jgi:hypothetical protein